MSARASLPAVVLAVFALAIVGCGSSVTTSTSTPTTTGASAAATPAKPAATTEDKALAKRALLKLSDFPSDWTQQDKSDSAKGCPAFKAAKDAAAAHAGAPSITKGTDASVDDLALVFTDAAAATKTLGDLDQATTRECVAKSFVAAISGDLNKGVKLGDPTTGKISVDKGSADDVAASRITVPATVSGGLDSPIDVEYIVVRSGRLLSLLGLVSQSGDFDETVRGDLIAALGRRAASLGLTGS